MRPSARIALTLLGLAAVALPLSAEAHRQWLLPSGTVLSGNDLWVTFDAAVSNDLFQYEHMPLRLQTLIVTAPDGTSGKAENQATGRYRSTFDVQLTRPGTYRIAVVNNGLFARWRAGGQQKRWMGPADGLAAAVPADAEGLVVTEAMGRVESFVTAGKPTRDVLAVTGRGLELAPVTHPNDLVVNHPATFRFLLDGKPAAGLEVELVRGGIRYRDKLDETAITTDADGAFSVTWRDLGMYWFAALLRDGRTSVPQARERRLSYAATVEVLPE